MSTVNISTVISNAVTRHTPFDLIRQILEWRILGLKKSEIGSRIGYSRSGVTKILTRLGLNWNDHQSPTELPLTEAELGYVCGLIATDGYICPRKSTGTTLELYLHKQDARTLFWLNAKTRPGEKLVHPKTNSQCYIFRASIPVVYETCVNMGMTPNKSLTLDVDLSTKSKIFRLYFLRGVIDGDGCIRISDNDTNIQVVSGSEKFVKTLQQYFGGIAKAKDKYYEIIWSIKTNYPLVKALPLEPYMLRRKTEAIRSEIYRMEGYIDANINNKASAQIRRFIKKYYQNGEYSSLFYEEYSRYA